MPEQTPPSPRFYSVAQVAEHLQVSQKTIRRWIDDGELTVFRLGRLIRVSDQALQAYLQTKQNRGVKQGQFSPKLGP